MPEKYKEADEIICVGTDPEIEDRFRDLLRVYKLEKGLSHAIKRQNLKFGVWIKNAKRN